MVVNKNFHIWDILLVKFTTKTPTSNELIMVVSRKNHKGKRAELVNVLMDAEMVLVCDALGIRKMKSGDAYMLGYHDNTVIRGILVGKSLDGDSVLERDVCNDNIKTVYGMLINSVTLV